MINIDESSVAELSQQFEAKAAAEPKAKKTKAQQRKEELEELQGSLF